MAVQGVVLAWRFQWRCQLGLQVKGPVVGLAVDTGAVQFLDSCGPKYCWVSISGVLGSHTPQWWRKLAMGLHSGPP